ncbi:hypothetical protein ABPG73_009083 [Tetrahymena malaccensis]
MQNSLPFIKNLSQQQIEENLERQEKDDNCFINIPINNYKFKQEVNERNQSDMSNISRLYEMNQDEVKQIDTTFTQKKPDFADIDSSQRYAFSDKKSQTDQFIGQKQENTKIQNEYINQYQDQIQSTNRYMTEKSKLQNIQFMTMLSSVPKIKKSNYAGDFSPNRFKSKNLEQKNDTNKHFSMKFVALKDKKMSDKIKTKVFGAKICNKSEFLKSQGLNKQSFKIIKSQIDKDLDILELYQDIIFLKKAIMVLFTTDQLAAIRLIGCSSSFLDSQLLDFETQKDISHYEKQFAISLSDELQYKYRNQDYQKNLSLQQIDENLERQEKDDNYSISIPTNNYKFKQDFSIKSQSECLNTLKQYELSQDEIKQTDNSLQIKQSKYFESEQNLKNIQAEKMLKKERFNIQKEENRQNQNDTICNNLELLEQTSRNVNEKNKIQNMTLLDMLSNSNYIKKSNYIGDQSPNKFKNHNSEQKNETNNHYSLKFVALKDKKLANQIQKIIFKTKLCKKQEFLKSQGLSKQTIKIIESQIDKDLDILELYEDIIFLKKAIMILFTTDQLAAIRLIGCSSSFLDQDILDFGQIFYQFDNIYKQQFLKTETQKDISHYEKQFAISLSDELQYKYVNKFLKRCQMSETIDQLDEKILTSMYKQKMN